MILYTAVITLMFYSFTRNHYIAPLHPCLMAKVCNHTGIKTCGLEKDQRDNRLFLDDCDMFEYNCDYKKVYSKVNNKLCKEDVTETISENSKTVTSALEGSTTVNNSLQTTTVQHATSTATTVTTMKTQSETESVTKRTKPVASVSEISTSKCTCMDLQTTSVPTTESTKTSNQSRHECTTCTHSHSEPPSSKTAINKTTERKSKSKTAVTRVGETLDVTESIIRRVYANVSRIPIATGCTRVITLMFYSFTRNHYISPLHPCLMAKICNHTGIKVCGLEKDHLDNRLFLDDCDMFEYNCDYKKAYSKVNDNLCKEDVTETNTENPKTITSVMEESTLVHNSSQTTVDKNATANATSTITQTQSESEIITIPTESVTTVSNITVVKCTCMDLQTTSVSTTESTITSTHFRHECTCTHSHSEPPSSKTAIDKTTEITLNSSSTTALARVSETPNFTESIMRRIYANVSRIPITTKCTRGQQNSTSIATSKNQKTESVTKSSETISNSTNTVITAGTKGRCTCMDTELPTSLSHLETNSTTTTTYSKTETSSTSPMTKFETDTKSVSTSAQTKSCTCNSVSPKTYKTTKIQTKPETITILTKPMTPTSGTTNAKCTCMNLQTTPVTTTEPTTTSTQTKHECTCTNTHSKYTINDKTTYTPSTKDISEKNTDDTTLKHSCDKYPSHCNRPLTWETTARGETRDFFQILKERFGDRVKILKDTTHWPLRMTKPMEKNNDDAFHFGTHNDI